MAVIKDREREKGRGKERLPRNTLRFTSSVPLFDYAVGSTLLIKLGGNYIKLRP